MTTRKLAVLALVLLCPAASLADATLGGTLPGPLPLFPPDNWWNTDVSSAPVDPNSANFIGFIGATRALHPDFGGEESPGSVNIYGFPYIVVDSAEPTRTVIFDYEDESDAGPYPIPDEAITQEHWIEGGEPGNQQPGGDRHMLLINAETKILYELYALRYVGGQWEAGSGAIFDTKTNDRRPEGWTSADAAGLAILPGLVRYDEVYGPDEIRHAFRFTVQTTSGYVFPASHLTCDPNEDPCPANALPMGARLRLKAATPVPSECVGETAKIVAAFKKYGLIVADNGSNMYVSGTFDTRWDNDVLNPCFGALTAGDFEVIERGWQPTTPLPTLSIADATVPEGDAGTSAAAFVVTLSEASLNEAVVQYATANGTATTVDGDYVGTSGVLTFSPGTTSQTVSVTVNGDGKYEADETFVVNLTAPSGATLADAQATGTITNDDPPPGLSVSDATVVEGDVGATLALFTVSLTAPSSTMATVSYATSDVSATAPGDYSPRSGALTFPPGVTSRTVGVPVSGDLALEADEAFALDLSSPTGADIDDGQGFGTITDDDALPALAVSDASVAEGNAGDRSAVFSVTLSPTLGVPLLVDYATGNGTAVSGSDYGATSGTLTIAPGASSATIGVTVFGDTRRERNEAFVLSLGAGAGVKMARSTGQGVIRDDDRPSADPCTPVVTAPIVLASPGAYCLRRSLTIDLASGPAVYVAADGVSLDLGGFALENEAGSNNRATGVEADGHRNLKIRNGTLRGFFRGVALTQTPPFTGSQSLFVQSLIVPDSTYAGIWVEGQGNVVGGSRVGPTEAGAAPDSDVFGIVAVGSSARVTNNSIFGSAGAGSGSGYGIVVSDGVGSQVLRNAVGGAGWKGTGILVNGATGASVTTNRLTALEYGIVFGAGATGTYSGNVTSGVAVPYLGGTPGGRPAAGGTR